MEEGHGANSFWLVEQGLTALDLSVFQVIEGVKRLIRHAFIGQGPEPFAGLQFGRVGRQKDQMEAIGDDQLGTALPAGAIKHQNQLPGCTGPDGLGEVGQGEVHHLDVDRWQEQPLRPSGLSHSNKQNNNQ